jgi:taspase (threonine aspartase 1)
MDTITDTVGVIAVDMFGHIAAGSSSGGIGMKHRGRVGPAALIGIGTHVIPVDPTDPEETTVAAVTSGTGEHIASSFGASTCASRLYYSQRMGRAGCFDNVGDEEAISAMIKKEFAGKLAP